jgi:branched-chain amino acid transport system ATP-binding protein
MSTVSAPETMLSVEGLGKRFGGITALAEVSFTVLRGEVLGIIGPNGAGKTTLFHLASGFEPPSEGRVRFTGEDIAGVPPYQLARRGLVRTFQVVRPFPGLTVLENLMVGGLDNRVFDAGGELRHARERALAVAQRVGLTPWLHREAATLPYGSLKHLEVGRAMMLEPTLLLLDEPFAGMAGQESEQLFQVVSELAASGITVVIIEHKLRILMRLVRRVIVLNFGRLIADGTPEQIAGNPAVQEAYLGAKGATRFA